MKMNKYLTLIKILTLIGVAGALEKCQPIRLQNGRARIQRQGRLVRFRCFKGYEFVGRRYMNCFRGQWDFERDPFVNPPMCVKPGCRASSYVNGHFLETYKGAVVSVVCNLGYTLIGSSTVYCNGHEWNQPFPECKAINPTPPKSCDFEDGFCGWTQVPNGDWRWHEAEEAGKESIYYEACGKTESDVKPPYGCGNVGGYMFLGNSSSRIANATERFFSPVFPPEYSKNSCFTFWYMMNGSTAGYLKVFVVPEGAELYNTIPPFWMNGHQGYLWIPGYFPLYSSQASFQVVIEGMSLPGNESETAFDDVQILSGKECASFREIYLSYLRYTSTTAETSDDDDGVSCVNRCGTAASNANATSKCECVDTCTKEGTCCSDYEIFCGSEVTTSPSTTEDTTTWIASTRNSLEITIHAINVTDESNEIPWHTEKDAFLNRLEYTLDSRFTVVTDNEIRVRTEKTSPSKNTTIFARNLTTTPTTMTTTSGTRKTSAAPKKGTHHNDVPLQLDPSRTGRVSKIRLDGRVAEGRLHGTGEDSPLSIKSDGDRSAPTSSGVPPGTVEAVIAIAAMVIFAVVIAALIRRRRRKKTEKESMVEDSDVRFLTSDEFLDFTLARPADDDL